MSRATSNQFYDELALKIPNPSLRFMNHGFKDAVFPLITGSWDEADRMQAYCIGFLQYVLRDQNLEGKKILEVGSGRGGNCRYIAKHWPTSQVTGLEYCPGHVEFCTRNHRLANLSFVQGDAHSLPFQNSSFDFVLNIESSHCYASVFTFLQEVRRVLKPHGRMVYSDIILEDSQIENALQASGFQIITYEDITEQVACALELNRDQWSKMLKGMIDPSLQNKDIIEELIHGVNHVAYESYRQKKATYKLWTLENITSSGSEKSLS